ncbi:type II toxin-antitoxin system HicA family toxin [Candidatus Uhrbacteria bacterium]|nr:type II toxin-antitoxin system HicA family toxin [Candidatus Uhrbacteria bacterium]
MSRLRVLSGEEVVAIFQQLGFSVAGQKGSHVKLHRIGTDHTAQTLTIPKHRELDRGTLKAIFNQAVRYISGEELRKYFYE